MFSVPARRQLGLSLVEALITIVIIAFGLLAIAGTLGWVSKNTTKLRYQEIALSLAESRLAELETNPRLPARPTTWVVNVGRPHSGLPEGATMRIYSEPYPTPTERRLRRVLIEIRWGTPGDPLAGSIRRERLICLR
ncbi:MAG: prepilin-type N-terminal cleavage/methylation domain-containing protein [Fimbriimonadales bacterium]|jgi:type II secretory pathway pseudopilin PulG|nr:prepilin-type N-terminal cleavage/methylation domain-containing protein [Armatimonadota bacterium]MCX7687234.1 prepilin-type N-terminal cleavage/methylation domain-containing protein [Fimbriimonadales bacterium]CUU02980.1 hypothetical protein GBSOP10_102414 [Armatimonadetes bacterium GBS]CUU34916.1 hypothetical protein DCOP10_11239 [Armatimonadetes bacterium DC]CUU37163.1 hypothetical protein GXSOP10_13034 [Armatimonadetes bacterium GXS]